LVLNPSCVYLNFSKQGDLFFFSFLGRIFAYVSAVLQQRWAEVIALFSTQSEFSVEYFLRKILTFISSIGRFVIRGESNFCLLWIECTDVEPHILAQEQAIIVDRRERSLPAPISTCAQTFLNVGLKTIDGVAAGKETSDGMGCGYSQSC